MGKPVSTKTYRGHPFQPTDARDGPLTNVAFSTIAGSTSKKFEKPAALTVEERERWANAKARVEGVEVRDNEGNLKKAIKRKDKEKARSKKKLEEREEQAVAPMAVKQRKQADDIAIQPGA
ncbi:hypothetical protein HD554DRAFT_2177029 [Boletus coccyginus]|nr:hypothetical protein HD554DRAFT_2177029 [Boletus coccyginus]